MHEDVLHEIRVIGNQLAIIEKTIRLPSPLIRGCRLSKLDWLPSLAMETRFVWRVWRSWTKIS